MEGVVVICERRVSPRCSRVPSSNLRSATARTRDKDQLWLSLYPTHRFIKCPTLRPSLRYRDFKDPEGVQLEFGGTRPSPSRRMKLSLVLLLSAVTTSLTLVVTPALQDNVELPDTRFSIQMLFDSPLLPVNPTLAIITSFMSALARSDFEKVHEPCTYRSRKYRTVTITSHSSTETRFLLWGIYLAAIDMVKYTRFNDVVVNCLWNDQLVGQISVLVESGERLLGNSLNNTSGFLDDGDGLTLGRITNKTRELPVERRKIPTLENGTRTATIGTPSADSLVDTWNPVCSNPLALRSEHSNNASLLSTIAIDFQSVAGALTLKRNDVFLSFYAAMLHVAKFPAGDQMDYFNSQAPDVELRVHMFHLGSGCSVRNCAFAYCKFEADEVELTTTV